MLTKIKLVLNQYGYVLKIVWQSSARYTIARLVTIFFIATLPLVQFYMMKLVIDSLTVGGGGFDSSKTRQIITYLVVMGLVQFLNAAIENVAQYISELQNQKVADHMAGLLQKKSLSVDLDLYDDPEYHDSYFLAHRHGLSRPAQLVSDLMGFIQNMISLVLLGGFIFSIHPLVALLLLAAVFPSAIIKYIYAQKVFEWEKKRAIKERESVYLNRIVTEAAYAKEARVFSAGTPISGRFQRVRQVLFGEKKTLYGFRVKSSMVGQAIGFVADITAYIFVVLKTINGTKTIGDLVMFFQVFQKGKSTLSALLQAMVKLLEHRLFLSHFISFMKLEPAIKDHDKSEPFEGVIKRGVSMANVSFRYPKTEPCAVRNVSVDFPVGQISALVGNNGSGKSTLVKLIARLYDPAEGRITLDDIDYKCIRVADLRAKMSITFQDFAKYYLTIEDNIRFSDLNGSEADRDVTRFAKISDADSFISRLPDGYQQRLGRMFENSTELSVGQWQKVALARMFFKEAEVLIVDEPTSAIDPLAEFKIFEALRQVAKEKIVILVTHRLYNLKLADQIVVMSEGGIIERGAHHELIELGGEYKRMFEKQR